MKLSRYLLAALFILGLFTQAFAPLPFHATQPELSKQAPKPLKIVNLTIVNNTGKVVSIVADGVSSRGYNLTYKWIVYTGKTVLRMETGVYITTFYGCGREASKKFNMVGSRRVNIKCGAQNDPTDQITIK